MTFKNQKTGSDERFFYATENFVPTADKWDTTPLIFAQSHPDPALVRKDLSMALKSVKTIDGVDGYICGSMANSKVIVPGNPRLSTDVMFDDPALEKMYNEGKLALSSAFYCPNDSSGKLNGPVEPNHVLVFVTDDNNQPRDLGAGWWHNQADISMTHGGPGSGRYPSGSGGNESGSSSMLDQIMKGGAGSEAREKAKKVASKILTKDEATRKLIQEKLGGKPVEEPKTLLDKAGRPVSIEGTKGYVDDPKILSEDGLRDSVKAMAGSGNLHPLLSSAYYNVAMEAERPVVEELFKDLIARTKAEDELVTFVDEGTGPMKMVPKKHKEGINMINRIIAKIHKAIDSIGDVDDSSKIDDERPPVYNRTHSSIDGEDDKMNPETQKQIDDLDAKIKALQEERDALAKTNQSNLEKLDEMAKTNKASETKLAEMQKTLDGIEAEKKTKAWANLRDTQIPRGWLVGDKAEETQKLEHDKDPVAYLNKLLEFKRANPKEETGVPFTNQGDANDGSDDAKLNAILSQKNHIPGRKV